MRVYLGLGVALISLNLSCSQEFDLNGKGALTDNRDKSVSTTESFNVNTGFEFQTSEDIPFPMDMLTKQGITTSNVEFKEKPQLGKLIYDTDSMSWVYLPRENVFGEDKFSIEITGENGEKIVHPITGRITPVNDAPTAKSLSLNLPEDSSIDFNLPVVDVENQVLITNVLSQPNHGTLEITNESNFKLRYTPDSDFFGADSVKLTISDGDLESTSEIKFEVIQVLDAVVAMDGMYTVNAGDAVTGRFNWTDPENVNDAVTIEIVDNFDHGYIVIDPNQEDFYYTANSNYSGEDTFKFRVKRGETYSNVATITVSVQIVNYPPSPNPPDQNYIVITCPRQDVCFGKINASDPDEDKIYIKLAQQAAYGTISNWNEHTGEFTYYPPQNNYYDNDYFTFVLEDCYGNISNEYYVLINFEDEWIIEDSFERDLVSPGSDFQWKFLVDDNGSGIQQASPECKNFMCAKIFSTGEYNLGPMGYEDKSLFFYGREGQSKHDIYLASKEFDLSQFDYVDISFLYLIMDIGDNDSYYYDTYTEEYLRLEVCLLGDYECGLNPIDPYKLASSRWTTVFENDPDTSNNGLNGRNHSLENWQTASVRVELNQSQCSYCDTKKFAFRFKSKIQDGFVNNNVCYKIEDAVAIDKVTLKAVSEGSDNGCPWGDCPGDDNGCPGDCPGNGCPGDCPGNGCPGDCPGNGCPGDCPGNGCPGDCPGNGCPGDCPGNDNGCPGDCPGDDNGCPDNGCSNDCPGNGCSDDDNGCNNGCSDDY